MKKVQIISFMLLLFIVLLAEPTLAGPGGKIASAMFESFWGKVALVLLTIIFLPLIMYTLIKEKIAERRSRKDLHFMAQHSQLFDWLKIKSHATECFHRVHSGWENEDLSKVSEWMTDWYWQNQQYVHLDRWKKDGLINICQVKKITDIKPMFFIHRNDESPHENSMLAISITAKMKDYLQSRETGKVVEGSKRFKEIETIWSFILENGIWRVADIEEDSFSLAYAKLVSDLPEIETTLLTKD